MGLGWTKIFKREGWEVGLSQLWLSSSCGSGPQSGGTSWEWGREVGDQPPPFLAPHSYTRILGGARPLSHRLAGLPDRAGVAQEGPKAQVPCEGYEGPREPAASGGGGGLEDQDLSGFGDEQEKRRKRTRQVRDPWVLGLD